MTDSTQHRAPQPCAQWNGITPANQLIQKVDQRKNLQKYPHQLPNHPKNRVSKDQNGLNSKSLDRASSVQRSQLLKLDHLKEQVTRLETIDQHEMKLRFESELFVLKKRRNNLFRGFQKGFETRSKSKEVEKINCETIEDLRPPSNKNQMKIHKFLESFLCRVQENSNMSDFIEFLAYKHKLPVNCKKVTKLQYGYAENDIRKIRKYQVNEEKMPILGNTFNLENKRKDDFTGQIETPDIVANLCVEGKDCFDVIPDTQDYIMPDKPFERIFSEQKNEIFKVSRLIQRSKYEKESILKKLAYLCVKEVERKYSRSLRIQNQFIARGKKIHRECLLYWRKREKELTEVKKKKEKLEAELKKKEEQEEEAKKQEKRLQYIMYQSGLYSHFMATKLGVEGDQKQELDKMDLGANTLGIDLEAAQLNVKQIMNNKEDALSKYDTKRTDGKQLDLSSVDQGKIELVHAPSFFHGVLKEYQVKGLRWLNNLFEQGINGILADEMGLGKTIQAIALLAHISETKKVWGPFLVVAPNSTLYNWQQEFKKFCPALRVLPYWGNIKQRKTIRKFFSSKKFTEKQDSPFHVVITSYQLTVTDDKAFKRLKWQFMILDEAQAIKNIMSQRWKTLKEFHARNRLLLTGTPIQNNMAQLWALLNFVMPDLFDSHDLFNEWFSKDIEAHSQDRQELDNIKIQRLRAILKPFMLRRVKKDVEHEIGKKFEHQILCEMTKRQKLLYDSIKEKLNVKELFKMFESKNKVENLMNLVMQLRKVCNHPELFERRPPRSPFMFQDIYYYTGYTPIKAGDIKLLTHNYDNPIEFTLPRLINDEILKFQDNKQSTVRKNFNLFTVAHMMNNPTFSSLSMFNLSFSEIQFLFEGEQLYTALILAHWLKTRSSFSASLSIGQKLNCLIGEIDERLKYTPERYRQCEGLYIDIAISTPILPIISSISYVNQKDLMRHNKLQKCLFEGTYKNDCRHRFKYLKEVLKPDFEGLLANYESLAKVEIVNFGSLVADSSKLRELDRILKEKKRENGKVLIFCQMTKMLDILEDFMNLRKFSFFRLDGASNIADRRDMVNDFQKPSSKVFVFLLSTRAGGLGVTLTAANTVIFYDNDWNPTMDAQATDRAHRIGQSRDVNVYQLVTKGTIEQRIVKRAQQKKTVQSTVYEGASFNFFKKEMILELMVDEFDENGEQQVKKDQSGQRKKGQKQGRFKQEEREKEKMKERDPSEKADGITPNGNGVEIEAE